MLPGLTPPRRRPHTKLPITPNSQWLAEQLTECGVDPEHRDRLLGVIERRCIAGRNGATWQVETASRPGATLAGMLTQYRELMHSNLPVHEWSS